VQCVFQHAATECPSCEQSQARSRHRGEIRKQYENDPTYQDQVLGAMAGVFKQDVSGVFTGQSLVG